MVNSLVCGDMYKIPKVAPMVDTMKIHRRNLEPGAEVKPEV